MGLMKRDLVVPIFNTIDNLQIKSQSKMKSFFHRMNI